MRRLLRTKVTHSNPNPELQKPLVLLGIETSCDETGIAVYHETLGLISHRLYSQIKLHQAHGGVVPELASRDHLRVIRELTNRALNDAQLPLTPQHFSAIAYTRGPGLIGPLLVGSCFAKSLGFATGLPSLGIDHLEGHLLAPMLENPAPEFPFLALLVSGGHTLLIKASALGVYEIIGQTIDDAAGEAFDKIAKMLELPYPGGAALARLAEQGKPHFQLPRPMIHHANLNFSFSGLKTAALHLLKKLPQPLTLSQRADLAYAAQEAIVDTLLQKVLRAMESMKSNDAAAKRLVIVGGVSANTRLRECLQTVQNNSTEGLQVFFPKPEFCTDNGAMIAMAGFMRLKHKGTASQDASHAILPYARGDFKQNLWKTPCS